MTKRCVRARTVVVIAAAAVLVAACGGDDDSGGGGDGDGAAATLITVEGTEFAFEPDAWVVAADTDVTVTFENGGSIEHEWVVLTAGTEIGSEADFSASLIEASIDKIPAGTSESLTLNLPPAEYQVICAIPGHFDAGMEGTLTVAS